MIRLALRTAAARSAVPALIGISLLGCSSDDGGDDGAAGGSGTAGSSSGSGGSNATGGSSTGGSSSGGSSSGGSSTGGSSGGGSLAYQPCALDARVGTFTIELGDGYTAVTGSVRDAVQPSDVPDLVSEEGSCRLYEQRNLFCDPPCGSGTTCGEAMACVASPSNQSVGTVSVSGLAVPLEMMPSGVNSYTNPAIPELPHPGFSEGADIVLSATGGAYAPLELHGRGISALELEGESLTVVEGQPLAVRWMPPGQVNGQMVHLTFEFNRHGGTPTWLECDAPDTGSFDVPAALVSALLELELSGWPTLAATRRTVDSRMLAPGCVELRVVSSVTIDLKLPGVTSCDSENPCPSPQVCQANLLCE
jgi:hypothetical protein